MTQTRGSKAGRRRWLSGLGAVALVAGATAVAAARGERQAKLAGLDAPPAIVIASAKEPGQRLEVHGQVFAPDGKTPVPGVVVYAYHTDAEGRYARLGWTPRLRGWMRTDAEGSYTYRTIRPGAYPGRATPAHVHIQLWGAGYEPQYSTDLLFADDPLLPEAERSRSRAAGRFAHVCVPTRSAREELLCTHHHRLRAQGDRLEDETRHGLDTPGRED